MKTGHNTPGSSPDDQTAMGDERSRVLLDICGSYINDYQVIESIGAGGGGHVFRGHHRHMERAVAIKILTTGASADATAARRFQREVQVAAKLAHPNIVTAYDAGYWRDLPFLVMEYVDGQPLSALIKNEGALSTSQAIDFVSQAAEGLAYAHDQQIVHRDIKPSNIMVTHDSRIKILDLGLARLREVSIQGLTKSDSDDLTSHGSVIGTVGYMSPEQFQDAADVDHRTDIYSLGCTLFYMLAGRPPYTGSFMKTLVAHMNEPIPSIRDHRSDVHPKIEAMYTRMVAKAAEDRYPSMRHLLQELNDEEIRKASATNAPIAPVQQSQPANVVETDPYMIRKAIGIDFGTANTVVASVGEDGFPQSVRNESGEQSTLSCVAFDGRNSLVGIRALDAAIDDSNDRFRFAKPMLEKPSGLVWSGQTIPSQVLCAAVINDAVRRAKRSIGYFSHATLAIPGCFGMGQRSAICDAFEISEIGILDVITEPLAIAIDHAFRHGLLNMHRESEPQTYLIFRLGAGTFDATVLRVEKREVRVLTTVGDHQLGSKEWDERIALFIRDQVQTQYDEDVAGSISEQLLLLRQSELAKLALSEIDATPIRCKVGKQVMEGTLPRRIIAKLGRDIYERLVQFTKEAIRSSGLAIDEFTAVLMAGGGSRMPLCKQVVHTSIGDDIPLIQTLDESVANGCAIWSQRLLAPDQSSLDFSIREATPYKITISQEHGGAKSKPSVIAKDTPLPVSHSCELKITEDLQTQIQIELFESIDADPNHARSLGASIISGLPPGMTRGTTVLAELQIATSGDIRIFTESLATGKRTEHEFAKNHGISEQELSKWSQWLDLGSVLGQPDSS